MDERSEDGFSPADAANVKDQESVTNAASPHFLVRTKARIAVYDDLLSAPRIINVEPAPILEFIEQIAVNTYERAAALDGHIPYSVIREIAENFIHADFKECTVSVLDRGDTIRFSDQGPGIEKKMLVRQPGVSSASAEMRQYIKGVGSGFPLVNEYLSLHGGTLRIDDNAIDGAVITLSLAAEEANLPTQAQTGLSPAREARPAHVRLADSSSPNVNANAKFPLSYGFYADEERPAMVNSAPAHLDAPAVGTDRLVAQPTSTPTANRLLTDKRARVAIETASRLGAAGPTDIASALDVSISTAQRLLVSLEEDGLLEKTSNRKRILSNSGLEALRGIQGY